MTTLDEHLAAYRTDPDGEPADRLGLAVVIDNIAAIRMIAAWPSVLLPTWKQPRRPMPEDARRRWLWGWSGFPGGPDEPVFLEDLAKRAGIPAQTAFNAWPALVATMLVWPDGTISNDARELVEAFIESKEKR